MDFSVLSKLGLSKSEIDCYAYLINHGGSVAKELCSNLSWNRSYIYKSLKQLLAIGFATSLKTNDEVTYYYANSIEQALENLAQYQRSAVIEIIRLRRGW